MRLSRTLAVLTGARLPEGVRLDGEDRSQALRGTALRERQERVAWSGALETMPIAVRRKHSSTIEDVERTCAVISMSTDDTPASAATA